MGKEHVVEIKGGRYRYAYDPDTKKTLYRGPVGDSPQLSEEQFLKEMGYQKLVDMFNVCPVCGEKAIHLPELQDTLINRACVRCGFQITVSELDEEEIDNIIENMEGTGEDWEPIPGHTRKEIANQVRVYIKDDMAAELDAVVGSNWRIIAIKVDNMLNDMYLDTTGEYHLPVTVHIAGDADGLSVHNVINHEYSEEDERLRIYGKGDKAVVIDFTIEKADD